jgi:hypothetical protein
MVLVLACGESKPVEPSDPLDPDAFQQYSGMVTVEASDHSNVYEYARDGSKLWIVPQVPAGSTADQRVAIIVDQEARTATAISWGRKQYFVQPLSAKTAPVQWPLGQSGQRPRVISRRSLAPASIDGHACAVETASMRSGDGPAYDVKVWSANDLRGFPLKIEARNGPTPVTVTFSEVTLGPAQDPALFKVPEGFTNAAAGG